jgi:hypothetical protein
MITKSKLALVAAIAVMAVTSPAFAQSYDPSVGTGNVLPFAYGPGATKQRSVAVPPENDEIAAGRSGLHAFARVPRNPSVFDSTDWPNSTWPTTSDGMGNIGH